MSTENPTKVPLPSNGVAINRRTTQNPAYRTYEVHQRERVGQSTEKIQPIALLRDDQLNNPFANLEILRENYPCYRDWLGNAYWLTRFDDVTSVFADRANFYVPTRAANCGLHDASDLSTNIAAHKIWAELIDTALPDIIATACAALRSQAAPDLTMDYALCIAMELQRLALGIPEQQRDWFAQTMWHIQRADSWQPEVAERGQTAITTLLDTLASSAPAERTHSSLRTACPDANPADLLATLLGFDAQTLFGGVANLCQALLTNSEHLATARNTPQGIKIATLETLRHAPPTGTVHCYARHEVERFGRLLPEGALLRLSALAANRDPRVFNNPEQFVVDRADICHREARGQFRADGLATGLCLGTGLPSKHPAEPEDRPRSLYALNRDAIVRASTALFNEFPNLRFSHNAEIDAETEADTRPRSLAMFEAHIAWSLPVSL